jgi:hypothetical protein
VHESYCIHCISLVQRFINIIKFKILFHQLYSLWVPIICTQSVNMINFFQISDRPKARSSKGFKQLNVVKLFRLSFLFLLEHLNIFSNDSQTNISIEFLNWIIKHRSSCFIDFIGLSLSVLGPNEAFGVLFKFLLNVENVSFAFFQHLVPIGYLLSFFHN